MGKTTESQHEKFKTAARELGADESEEHFKERLRKIAKAPVPKDQPKGKKPASDKAQ